MRRTLVLAMHSYTGVCTFTFLAAVIQMQKRKCLQVSGLCKIRITNISEEWHGCQMVGKQRRKKHPSSILRARSAQMQLATSQYSFNIAITEVRYSTKTLYRYSQRSRDYRRYSALAEECSTTFQNSNVSFCLQSSKKPTQGGSGRFLLQFSSRSPAHQAMPELSPSL